MPTRDSRTGASCVQVGDGIRYYTPAAAVLGTKQAISALNNAGNWLEGVFRHNNVVIEKWLCSGEPGQTSKQSIASLRNFSISGDIGAVYGNSLGVDPSRYSGYSVWDANAEKFALNKTIAKSKEPDFDLGVALAEMGETIEGLINPFSALKTFAKSWNKQVRRNRRLPITKALVRNKPVSESRKAASDTLDALSGSWLELMYGWIPLYKTIQDGIDAYNQQSSRLVNTLQRTKSSVRLPPLRFVSSNSVGPGYYAISGDVVTTIHRTMHCTVFWQLTRPSTWQEQMGVDATSIPGALWEKVPLSFVLDWFYDVGTWINAIRPMSNRQALGTSISYKTVIDCSISNVRAGLISCPQMSTGSSYQVQYHKLDRRLGPTTPSLLPAVNPKLLSFNRTVSAAALTWQRLPKLLHL